MNILFDPLPEAIEIDGVAVPINADFRTGLRIILAFDDPALTRDEQYAILLENLYPNIPANVQRALEQGVKFLNGGEASSGGQEPEFKLYSLRQDANYVFAAFYQTHHIDLQTVEDMHWWKFLALFMDLGADTVFCSMVALRKRVKSGKATKDEQRMYNEMRDVLEVDDDDRSTLDELEREAEFMRIVKEGLKKREQEAAKS